MSRAQPMTVILVSYFLSYHSSSFVSAEIGQTLYGYAVRLHPCLSRDGQGLFYNHLPALRMVSTSLADLVSIN
jgi:hypothetical protein